MTSGVNPFGDITTHAPFQLKKKAFSSIVSERNRK
jgi:hypothetical protein